MDCFQLYTTNLIPFLILYASELSATVNNKCVLTVPVHRLIFITYFPLPLATAKQNDTRNYYRFLKILFIISEINYEDLIEIFFLLLLLYTKTIILSVG
jgi:hypothetical protein